MIWSRGIGTHVLVLTFSTTVQLWNDDLRDVVKLVVICTTIYFFPDDALVTNNAWIDDVFCVELNLELKLILIVVPLLSLQRN